MARRAIKYNVYIFNANTSTKRNCVMSRVTRITEESEERYQLNFIRIVF